MKAPSLNETEIIVSKIKGFRMAWNENDLGALRAFLSKNIVCAHPLVQIGFVNVLRGNHQSCFDVLKFWRVLFKDFDTIVDEVVIHSNMKTSNGYIVECTGHYPNMGLSGNFFVEFDANFLMERIEFTRVMKYRANITISSISLALQYIKIRGKKLLA